MFAQTRSTELSEVWTLSRVKVTPRDGDHVQNALQRQRFIVPSIALAGPAQSLTSGDLDGKREETKNNTHLFTVRKSTRGVLATSDLQKYTSNISLSALLVFKL